jgi:formylglycine-generating enzyme required for sulfatase activity
MRARSLLLSLLVALSMVGPALAQDTPDVVSIPRFTATLGTAKEDIPRVVALCKAHFDRLKCKKPELFEPETPARKVVMEPFKLDKYEVTNARYLACIAAGGCAPVDQKGCRIYDAFKHNWKGQSLHIDQSEPQHPAVCVTWDQAAAFCAWAGGRLPTEQEWEAAARGPDGRIFPWGDTFTTNRTNWGDYGPVVESRDIYDGFGGVDDYMVTAPIGAFDNASPFGAHDMAGNVWEWTASDYPDAKPDKAGRSQKVYRGGGFLSNPAYMRAAFRDFASPTYSASHLGFRCAY